MGLVRITLADNDYGAVDMAMDQRGYMRTIPRKGHDTDQLYALPRGTYWKAEPTDASALLIEATEAAQDAGAVGARIVATAGATTWVGLVMVSETPKEE